MFWIGGENNEICSQILYATAEIDAFKQLRIKELHLI